MQRCRTRMPSSRSCGLDEHSRSGLRDRAKDRAPVRGCGSSKQRRAPLIAIRAFAKSGRTDQCIDMFMFLQLARHPYEHGRRDPGCSHLKTRRARPVTNHPRACPSQSHQLQRSIGTHGVTRTFDPAKTSSSLGPDLWTRIFSHQHSQVRHYAQPIALTISTPHTVLRSLRGRSAGQVRRLCRTTDPAPAA